MALVLVVAVAACGGDDDDAPVATSPGQVQSPTATTAAPPTGGSATEEATGAPSDTPSETDEPGQTDPPDGDVGLLQLVDKQHALPEGYVPGSLTALSGAYLVAGFSGSLQEAAAEALIRMLDDADAAGYDIRLRSGYRSYSEQEATFQYWVDTLGYDEATRVSAMPGRSEHQLGTAADVTSADVGWELTESFGATAAGQWLAGHAHEYGFALSYPDGAEAVTGYAYEPWHFRYIGTDAAADWKASGLALNKFLGG